MPVQAADDAIIVGGRRIGFTAIAASHEIPWSDRGVDIVIESSGKFVTAESNAGHFERGARKVIVAAPVKKDALNLVMGVNDRLYDPQKHHLVTAASCTTNCLAPVVKVIQEGIGIRHGVTRPSSSPTSSFSTNSSER